MPNFFGRLFSKPPDPVIEDMRHEHRETMQAIRQLTLEQFKKDLAPYSAEIDWENPSGRKPEPTEPEPADQHSREPGEPSPAAGAQLPTAEHHGPRGTAG